MTSGSYSFLFPCGNSSEMGTVWLEAAVGAWCDAVGSPGEGQPAGKGQLVPSSPAPLRKWLPRPHCGPLLQPAVMLELNRAVKCGKDVLQRLCLVGSHWAESSMGYRKIMFIKNKSLLAFKSALIAFTLKDTGCPPAPVLSSQLETGQ